MRRREFITFIGSAVAGWPYIARAQPETGPVRRVGVLMGFGESDQGAKSLIAEFSTALAKSGWKEGGNLRIELRWGAGDAERIGAEAKELVNLRPDAILGQLTPVATALARETRTIPIVFVTVSDPIGSGLAASIRHPGGNITGFTFVESEMGGKWVGFLKEIAPQTERVALLFNPATAPSLQFYLPSIQAGAS